MIENYKQLLIDALIGLGAPCDEKYIESGLVEFCGNQWVDDFEWTNKILELTIEELEQLYKDCK